MEASEPTCPTPSARDQPVPVPGLSGALSGQASPHLTLGHVILPQEQGQPATVFLKALPVPLYHTVPPGGLQPRAPLVTGSLEAGRVPFILSPLLPPEGPGAPQVGKPAAPTLTVNIVGALPVLSPGLGPMLGSPGKVRNAGKYLCPHCGRDCLKPSVLEKHIRSHTGERPFPCATCGIAFKTQSNLYKHRRTQTHLNNSRLSLESEAGGGGLLEEGDRAGGPSAAHGPGESQGTGVGEGLAQTALLPGACLSLAAKNLEARVEAAPCSGSAPDPAQTATPTPSRKACVLPRLQDASPEKEARLRKCESTDSGYLSRSDSAEQPPVACSPLHSLSEHSAESEGEGGSGPGPGNRPSLELEKRQLEERIARLISHNQAVVDDPQLDHVRPRKTVLSKQGSIDLPMPYTYKDSFHFDIRAPEPGRRRMALSPARAPCPPLDRTRPLFFHSVPTQLSTAVECVPVTRSNSLPFVEGSRSWLGPQDPLDTQPRMQKPRNPRLTPARLTLANVPSVHPRALVRQTAVEDLPCTPVGEASVRAEDPGGRTNAAGEGAVGRGRAGHGKGSQRKLKRFSQEKWQMYGKETFRRIYQKMKNSAQGGQKAREESGGQGTEPDLPPQEQAAGSEDADLSQHTGTPVLGDISAEAKPGSWGSRPALEGSLEMAPPRQKEMVTRREGHDQPQVTRTELSPTLGDKAPPCLDSGSPLPPPKGRLGPGHQMPPAPGPFQGGDLGVPRLVLPDTAQEGGIPGAGGLKEACPSAQTVLRQPRGGSEEPWPSGNKLPSDRKKLKVESSGPQEQSGSPGAETTGGTIQAASLLSRKQEDDPKVMPGGPHGSAPQVARPLQSPSISSAASVAALRRVGLGDKEHPLPPATRVPGPHSQLAAQPQAPSVLAALADSTFLPKYLLRLPQGETPSLLPVTWGPGQRQDSLCTSRQPKGPAALAGSGPGPPWSPFPTSGATPSEADSVLEDPSGSRPRDGKEDAQAERGKGHRSNTSEPAAPGPPQEAASFLPTPTCDTPVAQDMGNEAPTILHLCTGSPLSRATFSGGPLNPRAHTGELLALPDRAPEDSPPEALVGLSACCLFQPGSFLEALSRPQGMPIGQSELALPPHLGTSRSCGAQSTFPSLSAEPRLTWCCLSRSLPLPSEQEKATSVYLALHFPGGRTRDEGPNAWSLSSGGHPRTSSRGGPAQTPKLSDTTVLGMRSQDPVSYPERKKGLCRRRVKLSRGNSKQKKRRLHPKRGEGSFWQSRAQLRATRLRRLSWVPRRSCAPPPLEGLEPPGTLGQASSEATGQSLQGEPSCASTELSLGHGTGERKEDDGRQISEPIAPNASSRTAGEIDELPGKAISPSAGEHGDSSPPEDTADVSGLPLHTHMPVTKDDALPQGKGLAFDFLETQLLVSQDQVSADPEPCISSDAQEPSFLGFKGTLPCHDIATSAAAICISLGVRPGGATLRIHSAEPRDPSWAAGEALTQSSPNTPAMAEGTSQTLLPGKASPGQRTCVLAPLEPPRKTHLEISAAGPNSTGSHQEEEKYQADFPSGGQYRYEEVATSSPTLGSDNGKCQASGLNTLKGYVVPSNPGESSEAAEAPSRSIRKKSLEGMRKQTRVELSDTSSDDEDRLVIEI